jgi:hypothetical protein
VKVDARVVGAGALVTMAIGIPVATVGSVVLDDGSDAVFAFAVLALIGFVAGGFVAGSRAPDTPMLHGAAAAFAGFAVAQTVAAVLQVVRDEDLSAVAIVFNALLAASLGQLGGWLAGRRADADAGRVRPI